MLKKMKFRKIFAVLVAALLTILYFPNTAFAALDADEVDQIIASIPPEWPDAPEISA